MKKLTFIYPLIAVAAITHGNVQADNFVGQWHITSTTAQANMQETAEGVTVSNANTGSFSGVCNITLLEAGRYQTDCLQGTELVESNGSLASEDGAWQISSTGTDQLAGEINLSQSLASGQTASMAVTFDLQRRGAANAEVGTVEIQQGVETVNYVVDQYTLSEMTKTTELNGEVQQSAVSQLSLASGSLELQLIDIAPGNDVVKFVSANQQAVDAATASVSIETGDSVQGSFTGTDANGNGGFTASFQLAP